MLNYICSELYRITHTRPAYVLAAILCPASSPSIWYSISGAAA